MPSAPAPDLSSPPSQGGREVWRESEEGEGTRVSLYFPTVEKRVRLLEAGHGTDDAGGETGEAPAEAPVLAPTFLLHELT